MKLLSSEVVSEAYKVTKTLTGIECDICDKVIEPDWYDKKAVYYEVTTGHHDWGNDSIDSRETEDLCVECIKARFSDFLVNGSSTAYFEVETRRLYPMTQVKYVDNPPKDGVIEKEGHDWF